MFRSRTFWTVVALLLVAEMPVLKQILSALGYQSLEIALGVLAVYFHVNPNQVYTPAGVTPPTSGETTTVTQP